MNQNAITMVLSIIKLTAVIAVIAIPGIRDNGVGIVLLDGICNGKCGIDVSAGTAAGH